MKRRTFGLLAGSSMLALGRASGGAFAQSASTSSLGAGLTPVGAELAGNADGSIPAWTGGLTVVPEGVRHNGYVPELFPDEHALITIDSSNMAEHATMLSAGVMAMMTKYGFKLDVFPTHRTAACPQWVYDNIVANKSNARFTAQDPDGGRLGFENAYGGIPFPVPDITKPFKAGGEILWNHVARWLGFCYQFNIESWTVSNGHKTMALAENTAYKCPYVDPNGSLSKFSGNLQYNYSAEVGPTNLIGQEIVVWYSTNPYQHPQQVWELINGEGRVRRAPQVSFDTPASQSDGIAGYDEYFGFNGSLERYDWKYLGKQEMYVPYNNNGLYAADPKVAHLSQFLDPNLVRWEKHRCWVVEGTVHPGKRNVLARRRYYIDEDTWAICLGDGYDANDTLYKVSLLYNNCRPDLPGVVYGQNSLHNLQTDDYASLAGAWNQNKKSSLSFVENFPDSLFDPQNMAASGQY